MANSLNITKQLTSDNQREIVASVVPGGTLPIDIFIYENTGTTDLGDYIGICNLQEYQRLKTFQGQEIPKFGNRYIKTVQAKILLNINDDADVVVDQIVNTATLLSLSLIAASATTEIINIP